MILSKIRLCINYSSKQHPSILQVPCECKNTLTTHLQLTYTTLETSQQQHKKAVSNSNMIRLLFLIIYPLPNPSPP